MKGITVDLNVTRRRVMGTAALAGVGVAVAACSGEQAPTSAEPAPAGSAAAPPAATDAPAAGGNALAATADVPVGGGVITEQAVITQPEAGTYKAFSPVCTHQGCKVKSVDAGKIVCPCHNSQFSIADGSVQGGPAATPLPEVPIKVEGDQILLG
ncbi:Rieske (2Fe-2S) protein [Herbidospora cretacea]|uniref:Rieske (2Fe-2S) protein n=1 Tax=Herbidospora cretacea TaxID=28444 RepID=UPI0004C4590F|nr:Rieske (2Fe-2S) protein [Herbidospora cretacea]